MLFGREYRTGEDLWKCLALTSPHLPVQSFLHWKMHESALLSKKKNWYMTRFFPVHHFYRMKKKMASLYRTLHVRAIVFLILVYLLGYIWHKPMCSVAVLVQDRKSMQEIVLDFLAEVLPWKHFFLSALISLSSVLQFDTFLSVLF